MALITSTTSGLYGTGATWVGGIAPVEGDSVVIAHTGTALETFSTDATGYAIGATAITLTGAVAAGSYVIGESVQFGSDPNYYTITNWVAGTKVLTVSALIVAIPASATLVKARGHVVTVDGTYVAGDDTTTAFTVNGTLRASRTVNSSLTIKGQLLTAASIGACIDYGRRSLSDPIPSTKTATLILNKSAAMVTFKYGLFVADTSNAYFCGATKSINSRLTADLAASGTSVTVDDITGWAVGDNIIFAPSDGTATHYDEKTISTLTPGTGTTGTITFSAVTYAHGSNCPIGNRTNNVIVKNFDTSTCSFICFRHTATTSNNRREVDYTTFERVGSNNALTNTQIFVSASALTLVTPFVTCTHNFFYNCNSNTAIFLSVWNSGGFYLDNLAFFDTVFSGICYYTASGTYVGIKNSVWYYNSGVQIFSAFSQGGQGCLYTDNTHAGVAGNLNISWTNGDGGLFTRCGFHTALAGNGYMALNCGSGQFVNCNFGKLVGTSPCPSLWGSPALTYVNNTNSNASKGDWTFTDCNFGTPVTSFNTFGAGTITPNPQWILRVANKNLDPLVQEIYTPNGNIVRDNTSKVSGVQSLKMSPTSATNALTFSLYVPAPTGKKVGVSGYLWRDTSNVTTVTLSGLGITASTYTASGALSANEQFFVSGTQTTGTDGFLLLTFSTIGASGNLWVDAVSAPQAAAIDFGEFGYWSNALPAQVIAANYVASLDVWNTLASNVTVPGSMGKVVKFIKTYLLSK